MRLRGLLRTTWIVLAGALLLAPARPAAAQDDWDAADRAAVAGPVRQPQFNVEMNLNQWIFRNANVAQARDRIDSLLTLRLDCLERGGGLSKAQIEKLQWAGRADVMRFFRDVDALKEECKGLNFNDQRFQQIWPKVNALQGRLSTGLFDDNSLFHKVLEGMSRSGTSPPFQQQERQRRKFRQRAAIELALTTFEMGVPLTDIQRQKFLKLLVEELEPPKRFGGMDQYVVFYQASKLDEQKLRPIFDDAQWRAVNEMFRRARGMEVHLRTQGFIP
jgi:hypothetical protein